MSVQLCDWLRRTLHGKIQDGFAGTKSTAGAVYALEIALNDEIGDAQ
jgi:hypothetical protein